MQGATQGVGAGGITPRAVDLAAIEALYWRLAGVAAADVVNLLTDLVDRSLMVVSVTCVRDYRLLAGI